ncbi:MAG TPA: AAA family ATPase, partial [Candidatus Cloacimonadota bacterium]|nr:AAA family ATPase [Candidatus Cloacimonadota bacterium]
LTFKDIKSNNLAHCMDSLFDLIAKLFQEHYHILKNDFMGDFDINFYNRILSKTGSLSDYENSLKYLSEYLYKYHKVNPVILIDEYDMPIQSAYINNYYEDLIIFIRNLLSGCLKDNVYLEKAVLTGILRVAKESIFSGLNNLKVCSMISKFSADKFGFTEEEVAQFLTAFDLAEKLPKVKEWYDGYNYSGIEIYNPWSILNYISEQEIRPYWVNTSGNELIKTLLLKASDLVKQDMEILVNEGCVKKQVEDNIVYADIDQNDDSLWNFLLMSGYLRYDNFVQEEEVWYADLKIPNREVKYLFESEVIKKWFSNMRGSLRLDSVLTNLTEGDLKLFKKMFIQFCQSSFSYFDVSGQESEKFYHAFVLGMIVSLRDQYTIKSNRESGYGRYDIMMIPKALNKRGIIFEFKKVDTFENEDFDTALLDAKKQINEKQYVEELRTLGVKNIACIAAVFDKKEVRVDIF